MVEKKPEGGLSFEFAKIWSADKDSLEEVQEADGNDNSWSLTLQKIAAEQASARVAEKASGRGVRRKATNVAGVCPSSPSNLGKLLDYISSPMRIEKTLRLPSSQRRRPPRLHLKVQIMVLQFRRRRCRLRLRTTTESKPHTRNPRRQKARNEKRRPVHQDPRPLSTSRMQRMKCAVSATRTTPPVGANVG